MTAAERIAQMEAENASLRAALAAAQQQVAHLTARLRDLEQRLAKDSHNSSKPPSSSDGTVAGWVQEAAEGPAKNLLDALLHQPEQVLAFVEDAAVPFTKGQAERDLRMVKVQQKISGTFRSAAGATAFCRLRSYLSTMRKQGYAMLPALNTVFLGRPFPHRLG